MADFCVETKTIKRRLSNYALLLHYNVVKRYEGHIT